MLTQVRYSLALVALLSLPVFAGLDNDNKLRFPDLARALESIDFIHNPHLTIESEDWAAINQLVFKNTNAVNWLTSLEWANFPGGIHIPDSTLNAFITWLLPAADHWYQLYNSGFEQFIPKILASYHSNPFNRINVPLFLEFLSRLANDATASSYLASLLNQHPIITQLFLFNLETLQNSAVQSTDFFYYISTTGTLKNLLEQLQQENLTRLKSALEKWLLQNSTTNELTVSNAAINWLNGQTTDQLCAMNQLPEEELLQVLSTQQLLIMTMPVNGFSWTSSDGSILVLESPSGSSTHIISNDNPPGFGTQPSLDSGFDQEDMENLLEDALNDIDPTPTGSLIGPLLENINSPSEAANLLMEENTSGSFDNLLF